MKDRGPVACDRCGGPVEQPPTGRRRLYCTRTCRELAYRERARKAAVRDALRAAGVDPDTVSSTVGTAPVQPIPVTSVVETGPALPPGPSQRKRRRLLPPPPGVRRT